MYCYIALTEEGLKKYNKYFNVSQKWKDIDWQTDIREIEIILVSKRKLRAYYNKEMVRLVKQLNVQNNKFFADIEYKGLGKKILRQNSEFLQNIHSSQRNEILEMYQKNFIPIDYVKNAKRLRYTDGRFNYVKTFSLAEQPINLIVRKTDLLKIAGYDSKNPDKKYGHYFVTKEFGLKREPIFWDFQKGKWISQN